MNTFSINEIGGCGAWCLGAPRTGRWWLHELAEGVVEDLDVARHHVGRQAETETLGACRYSRFAYGEGLDAVAGEKLSRQFHRLVGVAYDERLYVKAPDSAGHPDVPDVRGGCPSAADCRV